MNVTYIVYKILRKREKGLGTEKFSKQIILRFHKLICQDVVVFPKGSKGIFYYTCY